MFQKILVANRGEIAVRAFRAATELGAKTVAVFPHEDRNSEHRLKADESYQIGEEGHPVRAYLDHENIVRVAVEAGADAVYPGYGFLSENPLPRRGLRGARHHLRRPPGPGAAPRRQQGPRGGRGPRGGAADAAQRRTRRRPRRARGGGRGRRFPRVRQGGLRRWWARDAPRRRPGHAARGARGRPARGRRGLRGPHAVPRAGGRPAAPHRGPGAGRRRRPRPSPLRAGLLGATAAPEGRRDRTGAEPRPRPA